MSKLLALLCFLFVVVIIVVSLAMAHVAGSVIGGILCASYAGGIFLFGFVWGRWINSCDAR